MSTLERQVATLRKSNIISKSSAEGRPSLFLTKKEAAGVDFDVVYDTAVKGLATLRQYDDRFGNFDGNVMHNTSVTFQRELKSQEENDTINKQLTMLIRLLSLYANEPPAHKVLEYLLQRYRINEYNRDELLIFTIHIHDEKIFARIVQLCSCQGTMWAFLEGVKRSGVSPPKELLLKRIRKDNALLEKICMNVRSAMDLSSRRGIYDFSQTVVGADRIMSFFTFLLVDYASSGTFNEDNMRTLYPMFLEGLKSPERSFNEILRTQAVQNVDAREYSGKKFMSILYCKSMCCILCQISHGTNFGKPFVNTILNVLSSTFVFFHSLYKSGNEEARDYCKEVIITIGAIVHRQHVRYWDGNGPTTLFLVDEDEEPEEKEEKNVKSIEDELVLDRRGSFIPGSIEAMQAEAQHVTTSTRFLDMLKDLQTKDQLDFTPLLYAIMSRLASVLVLIQQVNPVVENQVSKKADKKKKTKRKETKAKKSKRSKRSKQDDAESDSDSDSDSEEDKDTEDDENENPALLKKENFVMTPAHASKLIIYMIKLGIVDEKIVELLVIKVFQSTDTDSVPTSQNGVSKRGKDKKQHIKVPEVNPVHEVLKCVIQKHPLLFDKLLDRTLSKSSTQYPHQARRAGDDSTEEEESDSGDWSDDSNEPNAKATARSNRTTKSIEKDVQMEEERRKNNLRKFLQEAFIDAPYRAPAKDGTSLFLSLSNPSPHIRIQALQSFKETVPRLDTDEENSDLFVKEGENREDIKKCPPELADIVEGVRMCLVDQDETVAEAAWDKEILLRLCDYLEANQLVSATVETIEYWMDCISLRDEESKSVLSAVLTCLGVEEVGNFISSSDESVPFLKNESMSKAKEQDLVHSIDINEYLYVFVSSLLMNLLHSEKLVYAAAICAQTMGIYNPLFANMPNKSVITKSKSKGIEGTTMLSQSIFKNVFAESSSIGHITLTSKALNTINKVNYMLFSLITIKSPVPEALSTFESSLLNAHISLMMDVIGKLVESCTDTKTKTSSNSSVSARNALASFVPTLCDLLLRILECSHPSDCAKLIEQAMSALPVVIGATDKVGAQYFEGILDAPLDTQSVQGLLGLNGKASNVLTYHTRSPTRSSNDNDSDDMDIVDAVSDVSDDDDDTASNISTFNRDLGYKLLLAALASRRPEHAKLVPKCLSVYFKANSLNVLFHIILDMGTPVHAKAGALCAVAMYVASLKDSYTDDKASGGKKKSNKSIDNVRSSHQQKMMVDSVLLTLQFICVVAITSEHTIVRETGLVLCQSIANNMPANVETKVTIDGKSKSKGKGKTSNKDSSSLKLSSVMTTAGIRYFASVIGSFSETIRMESSAAVSAVASRIFGSNLNNQSSLEVDETLIADIVHQLLYVASLSLQKHPKIVRSMFGLCTATSLDVTWYYIQYVLATSFPLLSTDDDNETSIMSPDQVKDLPLIEDISRKIARCLNTIESASDNVKQEVVEWLLLVIRKGESLEEVPVDILNKQTLVSYKGVDTAYPRETILREIIVSSLISGWCVFLDNENTPESMSIKASIYNALLEENIRRPGQELLMQAMLAINIDLPLLLPSFETSRSMVSDALSNRNKDNHEKGEEVVVEEEGIVVGSEYWTGLSRPLQRLASFLECTSMKVTQIRKGIDERGEGCDEETTMAYSKILNTCMDILCATSSSRLKVVLKIDYTRSLLMDLAYNAISGVGASTIRSLSDITSGGGSGGKKKSGKATTARGKKGRSASVGSERDGSDSTVYVTERLGSDIQAVLSCIGSSRAIQAQKSGILLLKALLSIDPSNAAYCISSLGSLLSSAALDLNSNIFAVTKLKTRDQVRGTDIHNTEYGFAGEILRSLIDIMNVSAESGSSSSTMTTIIPQHVLQPFCTHFGLMSVGKKSSLIRFAVNILGAQAIPAAVNILLTHALNAHSNESQKEAEALLAMSMDEEALDKQQENSIEIKEKRPFILLSRASQRKAKKVLKASSSEEYFRIATDITVRMPAQTQVHVLVSIIRCCLSFLDMTTTWSSAQSNNKSKNKSVESLDVPENSLVVVKTAPDADKDMDVDAEEDEDESKNFIVDPFELTKYSCQLAASEKQVSNGTGDNKHEDVSTALHMMSTAPSMVLLNLEFLYEIMEHKAFHRHIVAFIDNPNGRQGENSTQALFLEIFDHLLQLIATATSLQSTAAMQQDDNGAHDDDRFISVQLGSEVVDLSLSRFGNTIYTWSLDILKSLHRLLDTASFVGIIQELICHDQAKVRQTALMILSQRLEQTTYSRHRKSTSEERLLFLELLEQLRKSVRDATGSNNSSNSMDASQEEEEEEEEVDILTHSTREAKVGLTQSSLMCMDTLIRHMGNFSAWSDPLCDVLSELTLLTKNTASPLFHMDNNAVDVTIIIQHLIQNTPFALDMGIDVLLNSDNGNSKNAKSRRRSRSRSESLHSIGSQNSNTKSRSGSIGDGYEIVLATELKLLSSLSLCMGTLVKAVGPKALSNLSTIMTNFLQIVEGICDVKQQLDNGINKIAAENPDFLRKLEEFIDPASVDEEDITDTNNKDDEKVLARLQRRKLKQDLWSITILLRSAMAAITSVVSKVPSFAHPYLHRILSSVFSLYGLLHRKSFSQYLWRLSKHEQSLLEADINECVTTINRSIPARLMVPVLLKSTPALLNCGHAGTLRYALFLSNLWSSLDRKAVLGNLSDNSAICAMIMDYRRAYIVTKQSHLSEEVEAEIANCIVQFGLKLTETELNKLIARLGEWRDSLSISPSKESDISTEVSVGLKSKGEYARSISFYKLMSQFGRKLKGIFVPSYASVWSHCIDLLKHCSSVHTKSVSLLVKANNKNNGAIVKKEGKKSKDKGNKRKRDNDVEDEVMLSLNGGDLSEMILSIKSVLDAVRICCTYDNNEFVDESRYEMTMPVVANLLTSTYPFEHLKKLNDRGEENNSVGSDSDSDSESESDGDDSDDDIEGNDKKGTKNNKYRHQEDGGYMSFILQYVSPCLVSLALCVGKDVLWKPLNHHVLMATRNPAPMVRMAALKTLQTLFAEVGEEYLILLPECLPFLSELMEDDSSDVIDLTSEIIRYIEELSGEKLTQYLQ